MSESRGRGAVIVGASSGVGRALAERLAREGYSLVLCARDTRDLQAVCADLGLRFGVRCAALPCDLAEPTVDAVSFHRACGAAIGAIDALFVAAGDIHSDDDGLSSPEIIERLVRINFLGAVQVIAVFAREFRARGTGAIVAFSSIAAGRPRRRNAVYSAAKAGLASYCGSLQHAFAGTGVRVQVYALGYVDTAMSFGQKLLFPVASAESVADRVVTQLASDVRFEYYPRYWTLIVGILKRLPWFVFRRLSF